MIKIIKIIKNKKGFTLVEMLVVLLIISILILITIPNVTKHFSTVDDKGCQAFVRMVQGQVEAYKLEYNQVPSMDELVNKKYLRANETSCPNGKNVVINSDGEVVVN